jgi:hypothetical protein
VAAGSRCSLNPEPKLTEIAVVDHWAIHWCSALRNNNWERLLGAIGVYKSYFIFLGQGVYKPY